MKNIHPDFCLLLSTLLIFAGCTSSSMEKSDPKEAQTENLPDMEQVEARLIDGAGSDTWILESSGFLYAMDAQNADDVQNGMMIDVSYSTQNQNSYPVRLQDASLSAISEQEKDNTLEIGRTILDSLWQSDPALQEDIQYICVDLSKCAFLSDAQKEWLIHSFMEANGSGKTLLKQTMDQLKEDGLIVEDQGTVFEDGVYLSIEGTIEDDQLQAEGSKWRSSLGADFMSFEARKINGDWNLELTSHAVS